MQQELAAMTTISQALESLDQNGRRRVLAWASDAYRSAPAAKIGRPKNTPRRPAEAPEASAA